MDELGEFLERLTRGLGQMERRYGSLAERWGERFGDLLGERPGSSATEGTEETVERELTFGEQPELRITAGLLSVQLREVKTGERARLVLSGRGAGQAEIEIGNWGNAVAVDVRLMRGLRTFQNLSRLTLTIHLPEGTRVRARVDAGAIAAEGLHGAELDLRTDAGKLEVRNCHGRARLASGAGKITVREFAGAIEARADAGAITCEGLQLESGNHSLRTSLGAIDVALAPGAPIRIETQTTLGATHNSAGEGPADAATVLRVRTELGAIRIRRDEPTATPLRAVPLMDERQSETDARETLGRAQSIPWDTDAAADIPDEAAAGHEAATAYGGAPAAETSTREDETHRILSMLERREITAAEAAQLLAALRR